ncbi:MAG: D-3-phosphoglycerate dehydrogenase [Puniceicoccaceae bacterium MED-G32]|jgi:D-3-phosphoglycerate dehydrogenase|nr:MAG: D-3-phosphoglycerate dehydrogenase [Puniceicoccaceae bacterium MED-G32]|tara:strand:- start:18560 stop:20146 length:1587 start_codon:yes stop_codon:yes gene_type:complete
MKILVADRISPIGVDLFKADSEFEVIEAYGSTPEQILELVKDVDGIAVRSETKVTAEVFAAAKKLKVVGRAGVGVDNIDIEAATDHGVIVMNTPTGNTIATAELTFTHMLAGTRPIVQACARMREGAWDRKKFTGSELNGKTLGVLGMGRIGAEVSKRARAFQMKVLAYDPYLTEARAKDLGVTLAKFDELVEQSDYITVHMPLTDDTKHMINSKTIQQMKKGVRIFNCARGGIIDEAALIEGLKSGHIAAAGLDVYEDEPPSEDSELRTLSNLVITPHLGASTQEAQENVGIDVARQMIETLKGGMVMNALNMPSVDPQVLERLAPYISLGEKLGTFSQQLGPQGIEKMIIRYYGKMTELETLPLTNAIQRGFLREISENINDVNAPKKIARLGIQSEEVKIPVHDDFNELIEVSVINSAGKTRSISGSLFGKQQVPRIVLIDGHSVEVNTDATLIVLKNKDVPGIVGFIGQVLGEDSVNIANMSLSRDKGEGFAVSVFEIDSVPSEKATQRIVDHEAIEKYRVIKL